MPAQRHYSSTDHLLMHLDQALNTVFGRPVTTGRPDPAEAVEGANLTPDERRHAARLMRVNHTGEVCAQALYHGQAMTARSPQVHEAMKTAAAEESDHLAWCERRIHELGGRTSVLNPLFYAGSLGLGALAGRIGDRWSLGFVAETEYQVEHHLDGHLQRLPVRDHKSRAILTAMREDEARHADMALSAGGRRLPWPIRMAMTAMSKVMTKSTYWV